MLYWVFLVTLVLLVVHKILESYVRTLWLNTVETVWQFHSTDMLGCTGHCVVAPCALVSASTVVLHEDHQPKLCNSFIMVQLWGCTGHYNMVALVLLLVHKLLVLHEGVQLKTLTVSLWYRYEAVLGIVYLPLYSCQYVNIYGPKYWLDFSGWIW